MVVVLLRHCRAGRRGDAAAGAAARMRKEPARACRGDVVHKDWAPSQLKINRQHGQEFDWVAENAPAAAAAAVSPAVVGGATKRVGSHPASSERVCVRTCRDDVAHRD